MSVIVRMDMPKDCAYCPMSHWNKMNELTGCDAVGGKRYVSSKDEFWRVTRPSWCPIIGVLPEQHGDLIDRDHFKESLDMVCDAGGWLEPITQAVRVYCKKQVDAEKTIVPATERSET